MPDLLQIRDILVPIDFSESSKKAMRYAARFADQFGARLALVYVHEPAVAPGLAMIMASEDDEATAAAKRLLGDLASEIGIPRRQVARTLVRTGAPWNEITDAARTLQIDLIVLSTHGRTGLKRALLGSTAERVIRHAPCPVLVVRERQKDFVKAIS